MSTSLLTMGDIEQIPISDFAGVAEISSLSIAAGGNISFYGDGSYYGAIVAVSHPSYSGSDLILPPSFSPQAPPGQATSEQAAASPPPILIPAPVNGVSASDLGSEDLRTPFSQGTVLAVPAGTETIALLDGTISVGPDSQDATIQRLYEGLLGRPGDTGGLAVDDTALSAGLAKTQLAATFLASAEYTNAHGNMSDMQFVASLYAGFLGREPDPDSGAALTAALGSVAVTRAQAAISVADSQEAKGHLAAVTGFVWVPDSVGADINAVYRTALGRNVDVGTEHTIRAALGAGTSLSVVVQNVVTSQEYAADHIGQDPAALVASFYENALGRAPDAASAGWTNALDAGGSPASVVLGIATSPEASMHLTAAL